jgi:hypothetical protein
VGERHTSLNDVQTQGAVASALEVDDMDQWWHGRHDPRHERVDRLAEYDAFEVTLFEANGVVAEEVEGGDHLHSSVLAC